MNDKLRRLQVLAAIGLSVTGVCTAADGVAQPAPPRTPEVVLTLKPHAVNGELDSIDARLVLKYLKVASGEPIVHLPLVVASIPTQRYDGNALRAQDARGALPLTTRDAVLNPFVTDRQWVAGRESSGDITVTFRAVPRHVDANTRAGPLFDLRAEAGGLMGAGVTFLPAVSAPGTYRIRFSWDLSALPAGDRAASCHGDGDFTLVATADAWVDCYYAVGPLHVYPATDDRSRTFGIYWLSDTPFDVPALAAQIQKLFAYMSKFFHDEGGSYRVFIRKNPYDSGGGTALARSFMFGWTAKRPPTLERLEGLLAHEMTHNWPALQGEHAETSWYAEGAADYYSTLLSWRAGLIDSGEFLKRINALARNYYANPLQNLTLAQAETRYWQEWNASYVPYGRGFMYLAKTDAEIRAHSQGKRRLGDLVVTLLDREHHGQSYTNADWVALITRELGATARAQYDDMVAGMRLVPPGNTFGPCFTPEPYTTRLNDLGFDEKSLQGPQKHIVGLRPDSNAARAGLKDGDEVVSASPRDQDEPNADMTLTINRSGKTQQIRFKPEGKSVPAFRWIRSANVAESDCRY